MEERILTQHPDPQKRGFRIERAKYDLVRSAIVQSLQTEGSLTFTQLCKAVDRQIGDSFVGSLNWYVVSVKLDLEAREEIERLPGRPHRVRMKV